MPRRRTTTSSASSPPSTGSARSALTVRLQILAAVFLPMILIGAWLQSKGFFQAP